MSTRAILLSLAICAVAAGLEGVLAGRGVKERFAELRLPAISPPLSVWVVVGALYYLICFILLYRLLASDPLRPLASMTFALLLVVMLVNAGWNYLFFRRKDLRASLLSQLPYGALLLGLVGLLWQLDRRAAVVLVPYILYLGYAAWWGYRLWRLNPPNPPWVA